MDRYRLLIVALTALISCSVAGCATSPDTRQLKAPPPSSSYGPQPSPPPQLGPTASSPADKPKLHPWCAAVYRFKHNGDCLLALGAAVVAVLLVRDGDAKWDKKRKERQPGGGGRTPTPDPTPEPYYCRDEMQAITRPECDDYKPTRDGGVYLGFKIRF